MRQVTPFPVVVDVRLLREYSEAINQAAAGELVPFVDVSTTYSAGPSDLLIYVSPSAPFTVTLPNPSATKNRVLTVKRKNSTTHTITVSPASGQIDGGASATLTTAYQAKSFHSDGSNYWSI